MKRKFTSLLTVTTLSFAIVLSPMTNIANHDSAVVSAAKKVYYVPGSSYAYHSSKNCRALSKSKNIRAISQKQAKAKGLRKCRIRGCW